MNLVKSLAMALLLVVGLLFVWKYEQRHPGPQEGLEEDELVFKGIEKDQVTSVTAVYSGSSHGIERSSDSKLWMMREPEGARAAQGAARDLLEGILNVRVRNALTLEETDPDPSIYGLQPPELLVILKGEFGKRVASFGKEHSVTGRRYLQPEHDTRIYLVDGPVYTGIAENVEKLRNRRPLHFDVEQVASFSVLGSDDKPMVFKKEAEAGAAGGWSMQIGEESFNADPELIRQELEELSSIEAIDLKDNIGLKQLPVYGLLRPKTIIHLQLAEKNEFGNTDLMVRIGQGVTVQQPAGDLQLPSAEIAHFLKVIDDPTVYEVSRAFYSDWLQPVEHFFHRKPFASLTAEQLKELQVMRASEESKSFLHAPCKSGSQASGAVIEAMNDIEILTYSPFQGRLYQQYELLSPVLQLNMTLPQGAAAELRIGKPLAQSSIAENGESPPNQEAAPRFAAVRMPNGKRALAVISSAELLELQTTLDSLFEQGQLCAGNQ